MEFRVWECYIRTKVVGTQRDDCALGNNLCGSKQRVTLCMQRNITFICTLLRVSIATYCSGNKQASRGQDREDRGVPPSVGSVLCHSLGHVGGGQQLFAIPQGTWVAAYPSHTTRRAHDDRVMACVSRLTAYRWHTHKARWSLHTRRTPRVARMMTVVMACGSRLTAYRWHQ